MKGHLLTSEERMHKAFLNKCVGISGGKGV